MITINLDLPESLHKKARDLAKRENTSINQLISSALAEKISAIMTEEYIANRAKKGSKTKFKEALTKVPDAELDNSDL
jgi:hypothetical protein